MSILLVICMAGCATSKKTKDKDAMQTKISELESQLAERDAEIRSLEDELENARQSAAETENVSKSAGEAALSPKQIQRALKNAGYYDGAVDGEVGKNTKRAIREFQKANGLTVDGIVGRETRAALREYIN